LRPLLGLRSTSSGPIREPVLIISPRAFCREKWLGLERSELCVVKPGRAPPQSTTPRPTPRFPPFQPTPGIRFWFFICFPFFFFFFILLNFFFSRRPPGVLHSVPPCNSAQQSFSPFPLSLPPPLFEELRWSADPVPVPAWCFCWKVVLPFEFNDQPAAPRWGNAPLALFPTAVAQASPAGNPAINCGVSLHGAGPTVAVHSWEWTESPAVSFLGGIVWAVACGLCFFLSLDVNDDIPDNVMWP